ncbi:MAG: chemotaxis protein CheA, partial [Nitrospira sp.]|nr:chemotaxis protein CheA [Nitrospira sp.]
AEGERVAIMVDEILGQQQVVIKSMEQNFRKVDGIAGATILGNGTVGLILDVRGLLEIAQGEEAVAV